MSYNLSIKSQLLARLVLSHNILMLLGEKVYDFENRKRWYHVINNLHIIFGGSEKEFYDVLKNTTLDRLGSELALSIINNTDSLFQLTDTKDFFEAAEMLKAGQDLVNNVVKNKLTYEGRNGLILRKDDPMLKLVCSFFKLELNEGAMILAVINKKGVVNLVEARLNFLKEKLITLRPGVEA